MSTDKVVYEDTNEASYVLQFRDENGVWVDANGQAWRTLDAALDDLYKRSKAPYPYRIVERTP